MAKSSQSRRGFLKTLIGVVLGALGIWRYLTPRNAYTARTTAVPWRDVPPDGALILPDDGLAVVRLGQEKVLALDLTCTHLGCRVNGTEAGFTCPCHGSHFGPRGQVLTGPATKPLHELTVHRVGATLHIDPGDRS